MNKTKRVPTLEQRVRNLERRVAELERIEKFRQKTHGEVRRKLDGVFKPS